MVAVEDDAAQSRWVADRVLEHRETGLKLKAQAVLFRASHHSASLELELARRNIPFVKFGGLQFLEAAHVKDVLSVGADPGEALSACARAAAVLRVAANALGRPACLRVSDAVHPTDGCGPLRAGGSGQIRRKRPRCPGRFAGREAGHSEFDRILLGCWIVFLIAPRA